MNQEIAIASIRSRPRFKIQTQMSPEEFNAKLKTHFQNHNKVLSGFVNSQESVIRLRKNSEKFWAPQLQIRLEENEGKEGGFLIRGVFGPRPSVWTFFLFLYGLGSGILLTVGIYGWVEWALGIGYFWVWTNLLGILLILAGITAAQTGQKLSQGHLKVLRVFIERVLVEEKIIS